MMGVEHSDVKKIVITIFSIIFSVSFLLKIIPSNMYAMALEFVEDEFLFNGNIYYQINKSGEIVITHSKDSVTEANIPCEIDGIPVTEINDGAFSGKTRLSKVVIPDSVTKIGKYAFYQCKRLQEVEIPDSVTEIGWNILNDTPWIQNYPGDFVIVGNGILIEYKGEDEQVVIPDGVTAIGGCTFENNRSIVSITIPGSVGVIGGLAFSGCTNLTECVIPDGVCAIEDYAFNFCSSLKNIKIADSVKSIGGHAFIGCHSLTSVELPDNLNRIEAAAFCGCTNLSEIKIPKTVTSIGSQAFMQCASLNEITLSKSVESIEKDAFSGCDNLNKITIYNENCYIADFESTIPSDAVIYGFSPSTAEDFANNYQREFVVAKPMKGDMNENGVIDTADATYILSIYAKYAAGCIDHICAFDMAAGDMNENEKIGTDDAVEVLSLYAKRAAGLI